jgi:glycosyltransferase involved in cell wall biosynthesis
MTVKLAFLSSELDFGGAQRFISNLSLLLPGNLFRKHLILYEDKKKYSFDGQQHILGFKSCFGHNAIESAINFLKCITKLRSIKKKHRIGITVGVLDGPNILNVFSRSGDRIILTTHHYKSHPDCHNKGFYALILRILMKALHRQADLTIAVSKGVAWDHVQNFGVPEKKMRVIYNMLDEKAIYEQAALPLDVRFEGVFQDPVILTAGRLCKQKGQWHLIRSFALLKKRMPEARLMILGDGEHKEYLISLSKGLGLRTWRWEHPEEESKDKDVYFMGFQNNPFTFYKRASVFAFPSLFEGFGYVLTEAMVCGTPVVSADCRFGPREILAPGTDFLYETKVPEYAENGVLMPVLDRVCHDAGEPMTQEEMTWAEVLYELVRDPKRRAEYAARGQRRSLDFDKSKILSEWIECLR